MLVFLREMKKGNEQPFYLFVHFYTVFAFQQFSQQKRNILLEYKRRTNKTRNTDDNNDCDER